MILYGIRVPVAVWQVRLRTATSVYFTLLYLPVEFEARPRTRRPGPEARTS